MVFLIYLLQMIILSSDFNGYRHVEYRCWLQDLNQEGPMLPWEPARVPDVASAGHFIMEKMQTLSTNIHNILQLLHNHRDFRMILNESC